MSSRRAWKENDDDVHSHRTYSVYIIEREKRRANARERKIEKIKYRRAAVVCHDSVCGAVENLCDWQEKLSLSREYSAREWAANAKQYLFSSFIYFF